MSFSKQLLLLFLVNQEMLLVVLAFTLNIYILDFQEHVFSRTPLFLTPSWWLDHSHFHNNLRHILTNFLFTTCETKCDY